MKIVPIMVSVFTGAELIRNRQVRAPRESKLGKHKNAGAFFDLLSNCFFKLQIFME